jgi:hypothetical protein
MELIEISPLAPFEQSAVGHCPRMKSPNQARDTSLYFHVAFVFHKMQKQFLVDGRCIRIVANFRKLGPKNGN